MVIESRQVNAKSERCPGVHGSLGEDSRNPPPVIDDAEFKKVETKS